uniref:phosphoribosylformylglycinamidine synthase n=1 Tax=Setaria italica TaxID=4555 RepID=K3XDU4_SETIT
MTGSNIIHLRCFPSNMLCTHQRSGFIPGRNRRSRMTPYCLDLRHLCQLPTQSVNVPNIRPLPTSTAAVSRGINTPLVEESVSEPFLQENEYEELLRKVQEKVACNIVGIRTEQCFNVELEKALTPEKLATLKWLLAETYEPEKLQTCRFLEGEVCGSPYSVIVEVGPRMAFSTAFSTNAVSICKALSLTEVARLERSRRYHLSLQPGTLLHDRMTEYVHPGKLTSFQSDLVPEPVSAIPVIERGREALEEINVKMGLAFDEQDIKYYTHLFRDDIKHNPTTVELFDIAQSNSEHSRHWFFNGKLVIDGETMARTMFQLVKSPLKANPNNSVIGFKDNSSAIKGYQVNQLHPALPGSTSPLSLMMRELDILFTAETHNFPCAVAPYPGAETGAGGHIRDTHATGRGSFVVASTAESNAPWENPSFSYPSNLASPLQILIDASDGASDYGNRFGEPLIQGFTRNFGTRLPNGERREWLKPIMFSGAIGQIDHAHILKGDPEIGMLVVKIGGPAYRIGMGGELDFNAVQRGDAEMAQKLYRIIRACAEMGEKNPIISIHVQGAGENCNVVKEIIYPKGAEIDIRSIVVGDHTLSVLEIWGAEYQEQDVLLVKPESRRLLESFCERERVSMAVFGEIDGSGKIVLTDSAAVEQAKLTGLPSPPPVVDLELEKVLGDMPQKTFEFNRVPRLGKPLDIAPEVMVMDVLKRILKLPSICSKRFLTTKVDRCVTGLVAQQQTVGPLQLPLADVAVIAQTYTDLTGGACAIGEQPIKGLLNPKAMGRLAVGEALTNLVWAKVSSLADVKASGNWMYAAKLDGEGADMYDAGVALADCMIELGIAIDGGKDSLSMAAQCDGEVVKAPGNLVISAYVACPDITLTVTPDLKLVFDQIGNDCPDIEDIPYLKKVFDAVQELLSERLISAGHDISDGGPIVTVLEMAFAGNCGVNLNIGLGDYDLLPVLFAEELGLILEVHSNDLNVVKQKLHAAGVSTNVIGKVTTAQQTDLVVDGEVRLKEKTSDLRDLWEETSFQLEELPPLKSCVKLEKEGLKSRTSPSWRLSFTPKFTEKKLLTTAIKPKVAIIREEGSNSDREMSAAFHAAGFEPWDITMSDLLTQKISLTEFRGLAFVGGFSYADVLDSAKRWAASIRFNQPLIQQFQEFYNRPDTFSLGVCNGCQLMALLGWVPGPDVGGSLGVGGDISQPRFIHNESGRFECRFTSVAIGDSPAIMFKGMEGSTLGIWSAHGEGRAFFPDENILSGIVKSNLAPLRYCDDSNNVTEVYPFNPNGSPLGIAALCSPDGMHLAMMPHPERSFMMWQYLWYPKEWQVEKSGPSPWLRMFQNAREWCS